MKLALAVLLAATLAALPGCATVAPGGTPAPAEHSQVSKFRDVLVPDMHANGGAGCYVKDMGAGEDGPLALVGCANMPNECLFVLHPTKEEVLGVIGCAARGNPPADPSS